MPAARTSKAPNSTLRTQGRCFKCRKKGHIAKNCKTKHNPASRLQNLPVELLELICGHVTEFDTFPMPWKSERMFALRLTCRALKDKTLHYFGKIAFGTTHVRLSYSGLSRIGNISQHPAFATQINRVLVFDHDRNSNAEEFQDMRDALESDGVVINRRQIRNNLYRAQMEQADKAFVERSATDGIMLVTAFQRLSSLKEVLMSSVDTREDRMSIRRAHDGEGSSTGRIFSMLLSSLAHAGVRLDVLTVANSPGFYHQEGVPVSMLFMPRAILSCVSNLRKLQLLLQAGRKSYENHDKWTRHAADFISRCPKLQDLHISFRTWADMEDVFSAISKSVRLSHLQQLKLTGIRCRGADFTELLKSHPGLTLLKLKDMDITGAVSIKVLLKTMEKTLPNLTMFDANQIAQNAHRVFLKSLGLIEFQTSRSMFSEEEPDFFDEFERVNVIKYHWRAEEWEGVGQKIGLMSEDVVVSGKLYHGDFDNFYAWID